MTWVMPNPRPPPGKKPALAPELTFEGQGYDPTGQFGDEYAYAPYNEAWRNPALGISPSMTRQYLADLGALDAGGADLGAPALGAYDDAMSAVAARQAMVGAPSAPTPATTARRAALEGGGRLASQEDLTATRGGAAGRVLNVQDRFMRQKALKEGLRRRGLDALTAEQEAENKRNWGIAGTIISTGVGAFGGPVAGMAAGGIAGATGGTNLSSPFTNAQTGGPYGSTKSWLESWDEPRRRSLRSWAIRDPVTNAWREGEGQYV